MTIVMPLRFLLRGAWKWGRCADVMCALHYDSSEAVALPARFRIRSVDRVEVLVEEAPNGKRLYRGTIRMARTSPCWANTRMESLPRLAIAKPRTSCPIAK